MPGGTGGTSSEGGHVPSGGKERSNTQEKPAGKAAAQFVSVAIEAPVIRLGSPANNSGIGTAVGESVTGTPRLASSRSATPAEQF
jgi:hypothetical protein